MSILARLDQVQSLQGRLTALAPIPTSIKIETTTNCNHNCGYCSRNYHERKFGVMSKSFYLRVLDQLKEAGVKQVGPFFLGEPFTMKDLDWWVREAKRRGFFVFLTTNGTAPTPKLLDAVMQAGLDSLKFSCNYHDAEQFAQIARVNPKLFTRILTNIKSARKIRDESGYDCELSASYIMYSGEQKEKMQDYMLEVEKYVDTTYANSFYSMSVEAEEIEKTTGYKPNVGNPGRLRYIDGEWRQIRDPVPCWSLWEGHIGMGQWDEEFKDYRYHLTACCFSSDGENFNMADLSGPNAVTFKEAWNSAKFQELRQSHIDKQVRGTACESCIYP